VNVFGWLRLVKLDWDLLDTKVFLVPLLGVFVAVVD